MWKLFLFAVGFFAASFTTGAREAYRTPSQGGSGGYDQTQHQVVATFPGIKDGEVVAMIFLQKGRFSCPEGQARAVLVHSAGGVWVGCYRRMEGYTKVVFEDGDEIALRDKPGA